MSLVRDVEAVPGAKALTVGRFCWTFRPRVMAVPVVAAVVLLAVSSVNIALGSAQIDVLDVLRTLAGGGDRRENGIVFDLRLPRTLAGALVGAAFGLAGALFQSIARNPLASPDILGVTWGAGAGAVAVIILGGTRGQVSGLLAELGVPLAALAGGLVAGVLLYALSWRRGIDGYRMVLVGIGLSAVFYNVVYWLLTVGDVDDATRATVWLVGNLADVGWEQIAGVSIALAVLVPTALVAAHTLGGLQFGDDTAKGLGIRVDAARGTLVLLAAALAAVATSTAGPIAFVALATPQIALRLARTARPPLVGSLVLGATLVVSADLVVRLVSASLPVGVLTAILGAPYLLFLLVRAQRA